MTLLGMRGEVSPISTFSNSHDVKRCQRHCVKGQYAGLCSAIVLHFMLRGDCLSWTHPKPPDLHQFLL